MKKKTKLSPFTHVSGIYNSKKKFGGDEGYSQYAPESSGNNRELLDQSQNLIKILEKNS